MKSKLFLLASAMLLLFAFRANSQEVGKPAPQFVGTLMDGKELKLEDFKGKVIIVDFWASWCGPCRKGLPFLVNLFNDNKSKNIAIIGINVDDHKSDAEKFIDKLSSKPEFPIIWDNTSKLPQLFNLQTMPSTFFIDKNGIVRFVHTGFDEGTGEEYTKELNQLLMES